MKGKAMEEFSMPAAPATLLRLVKRLRERNLEALIVADGAQARQAVLERIPNGAEVHSGKSKTLEDSGIFAELQDSGRYDFLRTRLLTMDRATEAREMRRLIAAPDYMLGSVAAITEDGVLVAASATGSQLGAYASGAGKLILVVGSQKVVPDLEGALRRIREYVYPWEQARVRETMGVDTVLAKILLIEREWLADRTTVVLVRRPIGV
jgi:hypothetical protein